MNVVISSLVFQVAAFQHFRRQGPLRQKHVTRTRGAERALGRKASLLKTKSGYRRGTTSEALATLPLQSQVFRDVTLRLWVSCRRFGAPNCLRLVGQAVQEEQIILIRRN